MPDHDRDHPLRVFLLDDHDVVRHGLRDSSKAMATSYDVAIAFEELPQTVPDHVVVVEQEDPQGVVGRGRAWVDLAPLEGLGTRVQGPSGDVGVGVHRREDVADSASGGVRRKQLVEEREVLLLLLGEVHDAIASMA